MDGAPDRDERAPRHARRRWARVALAIPAAVAIVAVALAGAAFVFLGTQAALDLAVREIIARSEGRLAIEGAEGSLLSTVRVGRITWTGPETQLEAHDLALDWSPLALVERRVHVRGLGARTVVVAVKGSDTATAPPTALVLPFPLAIDRVAVGRLDWVLGPRSGHVRGLAFGYSASPGEHRIRDLAFVFDRGTLSANATLGATAPLALAGELAFAGDASLAGIDAKATLGGTLAGVGVDASGRARGADLRARATLTPFARSAIASATVDLAEANLAAIDAQWPATAIDAHVTLTPMGRGFAGTLEATNRVAGSARFRKGRSTASSRRCPAEAPHAAARASRSLRPPSPGRWTSRTSTSPGSTAGSSRRGSRAASTRPSMRTCSACAPTSPIAAGSSPRRSTRRSPGAGSRCRSSGRRRATRGWPARERSRWTNRSRSTSARRSRDSTLPGSARFRKGRSTAA